MLAVTSFSPSGYELYGRKFLESFIENWPGKIIVYTEGPIDLKHKKIEVRDFFKIPDVGAFFKNIEHIPYSNGHTPTGYNYNYDANKFCRKIFCQYDVLKSHVGKAYWLDADIVFKKKVPEKFLEDLFNGKGLIFLGRRGFHTETGLLGFDTTREGFQEFLHKYITCLKAGILFTLQRWHDCEAFDWARSYGDVSEEDLSPNWVKKKNLYVIQMTVLHEYLIHNKGSRKIGKKLVK